MPLQIRRGTEAERQTLASPLVPGELLWITDDEKLYIGNGTTLAKDLIPVSGFGNQEAKDAAASIFTAGTHSGISFSYNGSTAIDATVSISELLQNLNTNGFDISGNGNITISGTVTANAFRGDYKGSISADDSTILVDAVSGSINLDSTVKGNIIPAGNELYDLGSNSNRFKDLWLSGSSIYLGNAVLASTGTSVNLPAGSTIDGVPIESVGAGVIEGSNYNINIVADDSSILVNGTTKEFNGTFNGDVTGGNISGNIITNLISSADSSPIVTDTPFEFRTNVGIDGTLSVNDGAVINIADPTQVLDLGAAYENDQPFVIRFRRSRGSITSPTALQTNDNISSILFNAYDGNNYITGGIIQARVTGTVSAGVTPTSLRFLVNDNVGDTLEALRIDDAASLRVFRTLALTAPDGVANYTNLRISNHHASGTDPARFALQRSRGTFESPSAVQNGDPIYDISFRAYDGGQYRTVANIRGLVDGAVSSGIVPGKIDIGVRDTSGAWNSVSQLSPVKSVFNSMLQLPTFADETAADASIGGSGNRVNGMMYYDTALAAVRAVVGGSWTNL